MLLDFSAGTLAQGLREGGTPSTELEGPRLQKDPFGSLGVPLGAFVTS